MSALPAGINPRRRGGDALPAQAFPFTHRRYSALRKRRQRRAGIRRMRAGWSRLRVASGEAGLSPSDSMNRRVKPAPALAHWRGGVKRSGATAIRGSCQHPLMLTKEVVPQNPNS